MSESKLKNRLEFFVACVGEFARKHKMSYPDAFEYLYSHKGIDFLVKCYEAEHTLSYGDILADVSKVCKRYGGRL